MLADAVSHQETYLEKIEMTQNQLYGVRTDIKMEPVYEVPSVEEKMKMTQNLLYGVGATERQHQN